AKGPRSARRAQSTTIAPSVPGTVLGNPTPTSNRPPSTRAEATSWPWSRRVRCRATMGEEQRGEAASIVVQRRIEWSDTDASGAWHNSAAFRFLEVAETALLDSLGILDDV